MQDEDYTAERQAVLEVVGLIEIHTQELDGSRTRSLLETLRGRLERHARKQWGDEWAADAIIAHDPGGRVFHLRDDEQEALCFGGEQATHLASILRAP